MNKVEAIEELLRDYRRKRMSTASAKRVIKSCKILGLNDNETRNVLAYMDYCDYETGEPWSKNIEKVWK